MQSLIPYIEDLGFARNSSNEITIASSARHYIAGAEEVKIDVLAGVTTELILEGSQSCNMAISVGKGATLNIVEIAGSTSAQVSVNLAEGAALKGAIIALESLDIKYNISLDGANSSAELNTLQLASAEQNSSLSINMRHVATDCTSSSKSKCVASGSSNVSFSGLVYVAQDAQRTSADQNTRSLFLSDTAHIKAEPQLEIYADDVKCTHGATVGQIDTDAILYMRQRGLSEEQARRLQMEGFVADVVEHSPIDDVKEVLISAVRAKLENM